MIEHTASHTEFFDGIIVASFGKQYEVELPNTQILSCVTYGKKGGFVCGDRVRVKRTATTQGVIDQLLPRDSLLYRSNAFRSKLVAANMTQILVVLATEPKFNEDLLNRYLIVAESLQLSCRIIFNKVDLLEDAELALQSLALYRSLGYEMLALSAKRDIKPLNDFLAGHHSVLVGQSGVGKSSIINALLPGAKSRVNTLSEASQGGRHTTSSSRLYRIDAASAIIDIPGVQEFSLHHLSQTQLASAFLEFRPYIGHCRFHNCKHLQEPGCAIQMAAAQGLISEKRLRVFMQLMAEVAAASESRR